MRKKLAPPIKAFLDGKEAGHAGAGPSGAVLIKDKDLKELWLFGYEAGKDQRLADLVRALIRWA